jgi:two-component system response regulator FixJ
MTGDEPTIYIVDDDPAARSSLHALVQTFGHPCASFASGNEFLEAKVLDRPGALITDLRMAGVNGLELQEELAAQHSLLPVIFVSGHADVQKTVRLMQNGAVTLLQKPYQKADLLKAVEHAIQRNAESRKMARQLKEIRERLASLSAEEERILGLMIEGRANKAIARELNASMRTIDRRRRNVLEKMKVESVTELAQKMAEHRHYQDLFGRSHRGNPMLG